MRVQEILTTDREKRYVVVDDNGELVVPAIRYLKYLDAIGRARNTLRTYAQGLSFYFTYLAQQNLNYQQVTLDDLGGFVLWLKNPYRSLKVLPVQPVAQARSNRTINLIITAVSGFYDYLWRQDDLAADLNEKTRAYLPARSRSYKSFLHHLAKGQLVEKNLLKQQTPRRGQPKTLSKEQIEALVTACDNIRDQLLLTLLYESSLRIGESLALWIEDVNVDGRKIHVRDRGPLSNDAEIKTPASCRSVDISENLINQILDYLVIVHTDNVETNHLFIKLRGVNAGQPLSYADVNALFQRLKHKTGIDAHAHLLRHSSLSNLAKNGYRPEALRERAGHAQFQYTYQLYVHLTDEEMRQEWERTETQLRLGKPVRLEQVP
ncbi:MAG TPA: tyrosine-type recombinase/integrase [Ktedonobacteraceae bacterium]|nr:tyrosine-type recombinase/integrase [Ktedonobacteraceae bacterium]